VVPEDELLIYTTIPVNLQRVNKFFLWVLIKGWWGLFLSLRCRGWSYGPSSIKCSTNFSNSYQWVASNTNNTSSYHRTLKP